MPTPRSSATPINRADRFTMSPTIEYSNLRIDSDIVRDDAIDYMFQNPKLPWLASERSTERSASRDSDGISDLHRGQLARYVESSHHSTNGIVLVRRRDSKRGDQHRSFVIDKELPHQTFISENNNLVIGELVDTEDNIHMMLKNCFGQYLHST